MRVIMSRAESPVSPVIAKQREIFSRLAQFRLDRLIEGFRLAELLTCAEHIHRSPKKRNLIKAVAVYRACERNARIPSDELGAEKFDHIGVGWLNLRRIEVLEVPPAEMQGQQQPPVHGGRVYVNKALVSPLRIVPGLPAGAILPEMVPHRAHLHTDRFLEMLLNLKNELVRPVPALIRPAQNAAAVDGIEVDAVETARVHDLGVVLRDLFKEGGFHVRHQ